MTRPSVTAASAGTRREVHRVIIEGVHGHSVIATTGRQHRAQRLLGAAVLSLVGLLTSTSVGGASDRPAHSLVVAAAAAGSHHRLVYCTRRRHPRGCIKVPKSAKRPRKVNQQGPASLTPTDVENGGGLGGGPGNHRAAALAWATTQRDRKSWAWRCERFVEEAYGTRGLFHTALGSATSLKLHRGPATAAPPGSLMFFAADRYNRGIGHVGLSQGSGRMISALTTVMTTDVAHSKYWRRLYRGWADAPTTWPGRIPAPPGPTTTDPDVTATFAAPALGQTVSGIVRLRAIASADAGGVVFDIYYATNVASAETRGWHTLGPARRDGDGWVLDWDTTSIPDQGFLPWGTVNVAVTALDAAGYPGATRDYRRVSIDNSAAKPTVPAPTYLETTGGYTNTWTNFTNAGGIQGETIGPNVGVQISCALQGFKVSDGNTWWYRIASNPWGDAYYASADGFYNNGQTTGTLVGTPFVDPAVPVCP